MMKKMMKQVGSSILAILLALTMMPYGNLTALAEDTEATQTAGNETQQTVTDHTHEDADNNGFCDSCGVYYGTEETYIQDVKLVIPEGATATFYATDDGSGKAIAATDLGVSESNALIHSYELNIPYGSYSCMVSDDTHNYGGVGFDFPLQTSIYEETNITLVLVKYYTTNANITGVDDFSLNLTAPGKAEIIPGDNYLDTTITSGKTYVVAPRMVWAYGNQILYNSTITLNGTIADTYGVTPQINQTFASSITAIQKKSFSLSALKTYTLTAPTAAETVFYYQINNYNDMVLGDRYVTSVDNEDDTTTYTVKYPSFSNASYRVSEDGYVTAAGYCKDNTTNTVTLRAGDPTSTETSIASNAGAGSNIEYENSVLMNVDDTKDTNELNMQVGETFRLRGFRAAWEIVNTVTANIMIEPDFHYSVLSGDDVVKITPVTSQCTGNAKGNWMDITALKEGTATVAVYYDAIDIGGNTTLSGTYGATDPARYGVVEITVGEDNTVSWNPVSKDGDWDAEFDTVYYYGDYGTFTIAPGEAQEVTVQNIEGTEAGEIQTVEAEDGQYNIPVANGENLISVTNAEGTDYMVVRAKQITYTITNNTTGESVENGAPEISQGDSVTVHFDQFNMPVPKMSGIYNPGYMGTAKTMFTLNGTYSLSSVGTQYDFITDAKSSITFTAYVAGENKLTNGYIQSGSMGDNFGNHRNITDAGRGTNFSAVNVTGYFGSIEDISFDVKESDAELSYNDMVSVKSVSLYDGRSAYLSAFKFTSANANNSVNWGTASNAGYLSATVKTNTYYNSIQMKYWYEGETPVTVDLENGTENQISAEDFAADITKILNIQIIITPGDTSLGDPKVLSYVVYPGNANLEYVHPILSGLSGTNEKDDAVTLDQAINLNETDYTMTVKDPGDDALTVSLTGKQLQKYTNATNNKQDNADTVTVYRMKNGEAMDEGTEVYPLTADKYPAGTWTLNDLDITEADSLQIKVVSYVDGTTSRTYNIAIDKKTYASIVEDTIAALPAVDELTMDDKAAVADARSDYEALNDTMKAKVSEETLTTLKACETAFEAEAAFEEKAQALPEQDEVTLDDAAAVAEARASYEALADGIQATVPEDVMAKLTNAEEQIKALAIETMEALPSVDAVTLEDADAIKAAREAYDAIEEGLKSEVPDNVLQKLANAELKLDYLELSKDAEEQKAKDEEKIADLESQIADLQDSQEKDAKDAQDKITALETSLTDAKTAAEAADAKAQEKIDALETSLKEAKAAADASDSAAQAKITELESELAAAKAAAEAADAKAQEKIDDLEASLKDAKDAADQADQDAQDQIDALKKELSDNKSAAESAEEETAKTIQDLKEALKNAEDTSASKDETAAAEIDALKKQIEALATPAKGNLEKLVVKSNGIQVIWTAQVNADGYIIYRKNAEGKYEALKTIKNGDTVSYTDKSANVNGNSYSYRVAAYRTVGDVTYTGKVSGGKTTTFLTVPTVKYAKNTAAGKVTVKWTKNTKANGYQLKYVIGSKTKTVTITKKTTVKKVLTKLTKKKTVKIYVRAYKTVNNKKKYSAWSKVTKVKVTK